MTTVFRLHGRRNWLGQRSPDLQHQLSMSCVTFVAAAPSITCQPLILNALTSHGEPALNLAIDRDVVIVVETDLLAQPKRTRHPGTSVEIPSHLAAVADDDPGPVIDDLVGRSIVFGVVVAMQI